MRLMLTYGVLEAAEVDGDRALVTARAYGRHGDIGDRRDDHERGEAEQEGDHEQVAQPRELTHGRRPLVVPFITRFVGKLTAPMCHSATIRSLISRRSPCGDKANAMLLSKIIWSSPQHFTFAYGGGWPPDPISEN